MSSGATPTAGSDLVFFYPQGHSGHYLNGHPERPDRVEALVGGLKSAGWWEAYPRIDAGAVPDGLLERIHSPGYLELLQTASRKGKFLDADTYTTPATWELARQAVAGSVCVARTVWRGDARRGFALVRPPGHHASRRRGMGFCLLNNIAAAAEDLISGSLDGAENAARLAIVDLDLHHGNGTQDIFWDRGDVLYLSTHQSPLYPGSGSMDERGSGGGFGATANLPLPPGTGDRGFHTVMDELVLPLLGRFEPQMILVSYGFDIHWRDPLGSLCASAAGYGELIRKLVVWADRNCGGKIALFLEGGYDLAAGSACTQAVTAALLGTTVGDELGPARNNETSAWREMVSAAKQLWEI